MSAYSPAGQSWVFDIGPAQIEHHYSVDGTRLRVLVLTGEFAGLEDEFALQVTPLGGAQFLVGWQEASKVTVVHWEDWSALRFVSHVTTPDLQFHRMEGRMAPLAPRE